VITRRFLVSASAAILLAGCGRRGALEPPPDSAQGREFARRRAQAPGQPRGSVAGAVEQEEAQRQGVDVERQLEERSPEANVPSVPDASQLSPTGGRRRPPGIVPPRRSFVLDPLLD
jgi:predicted small lipoprotein YifL